MEWGSGGYKGRDNFLFLFLFRGHKNGVSDYADFLRGFFESPLPEREAREAPVPHVLYAWYYCLTSRFEEYAKHIDAIIRNLPRIGLTANSRLYYNQFQQRRVAGMAIQCLCRICGSPYAKD